MKGWFIYEGFVVVLVQENIDMDQLILVCFMMVFCVDGYGGFLLYDLCYDYDGVWYLEYLFNWFLDVSILVSCCNFGSGLLCEVVVYVLVDVGFKVVVVLSFGDIFVNNVINNGFLFVLVFEIDVEQLIVVLMDLFCLIVDLIIKYLFGLGFDIMFEFDIVW